MKPFDHVWIPDCPPPHQLAPKLSTPPEKPHTYIGILSRFELEISPVKYDLCGIISGPEPQRTWLENILTEKMQQLPGNHILILGKTKEKLEKTIQNLTIVSHMTSTQLNEVINKSKLIVARSGYSTIMDLIKSEKKAILIPTPGQPEQVYLAQTLNNHPNFVIQRQHTLSLLAAMQELTARAPKLGHVPAFDVLSFLDKLIGDEHKNYT